MDGGKVNKMFSIDLNGLLKLRFIGCNSQGQKGIFPNNYVTNLIHLVAIRLLRDSLNFSDRLRLYDNGSALFFMSSFEVKLKHFGPFLFVYLTMY